MLFFYIFFTKNWPWGAKTATVAKLRGRFCSFFFLGGQNRNFVKVGAKTAIKPKLNTQFPKKYFLL